MVEIRFNQDWMVKAKMQSLLIIIKRDFAEEGDLAAAKVLILEVRQILNNPVVFISDVCRMTAEEDLQLLEMLILMY